MLTSLSLGILMGGIMLAITSTNKKEDNIINNTETTKLGWTDSIQPYIDNYDYRLLQDLVGTLNYLTPNDILYLDIAGLDTYTANALTSAQRKIRSLM